MPTCHVLVGDGTGLVWDADRATKWGMVVNQPSGPGSDCGTPVDNVEIEGCKG